MKWRRPLGKGHSNAQGRAHETDINGESLELAGLSYWTQRQTDIASVLRGAKGTIVLLAHDPRRLREAVPSQRARGPLRSHARRAGRAAGGRRHGGAQSFRSSLASSRREQTTIFVSRGVGTVYVPIRINCPPEVAIVTLAPTRHVPSPDSTPYARTKRRPSMCHPPSSTRRIASG